MTDAMDSLQDTLKLCLDRIVPKTKDAADRVFFPNGIEYLHISATLASDKKGFSLDIDLRGPKTDLSAPTEKKWSGVAPAHFAGFSEAFVQPHLATSQDVVNACINAFPQHQFACNDFVTAVAASLSFTFQGDADSMVGAIQAQPWNYLGNDLNAAAQAATAAGVDGQFVVAGLTSGELSDTNGHVVVIVPGDLVNGKYPHLYCGSLKPSIRLQNSSINYAFGPSVRDTVHYGWIALP
jgi:hypothetical protein